MINLEKIKWEKCKPPSPFKTCPCTILPPLFLIFQIPPPPWEVFKIYSPSFKREWGWGWGSPNYVHLCNINDNHMMYDSWDIERNRQWKKWKKWKKFLEISSFWTCVPKIMITWCTVLEIWCATDGRTGHGVHWRASPPKDQIFQWTPLILNFFSSLTPSHLLRVTKFLVKISQFKFLVITEKSILVYKLFCS